MFEHETMVSNILEFYHQATPAEREAGFEWYPEANRLAGTLSAMYDLPVESTAAVIAALSPQMEWGANKRWATEVVHSHATGRDLPRRGLGNSLKRAERALAGDLSDIEREQGTLKVNRFYRCILEEQGYACVDRHALRVALGDALTNPPSLTDNRYKLVEAAYKEAAGKLRKGVRHVQAVTWLVVKRIRDSAE